MINLAISKAKTIQADATITAATNAAPIAVTTSAAHGLETGDITYNSGVVGNLAANGIFVVTVTSPTSFTLNNSNGSGAWTSGGTVKHIGFATPAALVDNTVFTAGQTYASVGFRLESLSNGTLRAAFQDSADVNFVTARTGPSFAFGGASSATDPETESVKNYDFPGLRVGAAGDNIRVLVVLDGAAGTAAQFSAWLS